MDVEFREELRGTYYRLHEPGVEHPITLQLTAHVGLRRLLQFERTVTLSGSVEAPGMLSLTRVEGSLRPQSVLYQQVSYELDCLTESGPHFRLSGEREFTWARPPFFSLLAASIYCDHRETARAVLRASGSSSLLSFLRGVRVR